MKLEYENVEWRFHVLSMFTKLSHNINTTLGNEIQCQNAGAITLEGCHQFMVGKDLSDSLQSDDTQIFSHHPLTYTVDCVANHNYKQTKLYNII